MWLLTAWLWNSASDTHPGQPAGRHCCSTGSQLWAPSGCWESAAGRTGLPYSVNVRWGCRAAAAWGLQPVQFPQARTILTTPRSNLNNLETMGCTLHILQALFSSCFSWLPSKPQQVGAETGSDPPIQKVTEARQWRGPPLFLSSRPSEPGFLSQGPQGSGESFCHYTLQG